MQHQISTANLGPHAEPMVEAVESCVHCGFCLPTCPTYQVMAEEMDSPRGRIFLMKEVLEEKLELDKALPYVDACLGCLACVTACPSGVAYGELLTPFRAMAETKRHRSPTDKALRRLLLTTLPYPKRFRTAATLGRFAKPFKPLLKGRLGDMLNLLPATLPPEEPLPEHIPAQGEHRARVALLAGCAQQVLAPNINHATLRVLARNGVEVIIPKEQGCCGALAAHTGALTNAKASAKHNISVFSDMLRTGEVDALITNAAGCGSGLHEYPLWLKGTPEEENAQMLAQHTQDISVFLAGLGLRPPPEPKTPLRVAYHDACHLAHAQGVTVEPRTLLEIPQVSVLPIEEAELCCGSAGTYNLEQPHNANELGQRKARAILAVNPTHVVSGNIGCLTQLRSHLPKTDLPIMHTVELLDLLYKNEI